CRANVGRTERPSAKRANTAATCRAEFRRYTIERTRRRRREHTCQARGSVREIHPTNEGCTCRSAAGAGEEGIGREKGRGKGSRLRSEEDRYDHQTDVHATRSHWFRRRHVR